MRLERITLQGFKSFGERTSLEFGPGVFGIVGPNGSGKSNIIEGLRWTVGARARELRGDDQQSLLFHGGEQKAATGFAEVQVEITKDRERMNLSRRLDRDGDADVRVNGNRATLRQIEQALLGTGLGRHGYAVVGQGEIGEVLQAGPEVLLAYLEEAAGLRAVTQAAKLARDRLETASEELQTIALKFEDQKVLSSQKEEQARTAQRATELATRQLILRRSVLQARIREAEGDARGAIEKARSLEAERMALSEQLARLSVEKGQAGEALEGAQAQFAEAQRQAEVLGGEYRLAEQAAGFARQAMERLQRERLEIQQRIVRLVEQQAPQPPLSAELRADQIASLESALRDLEGQIQLEETRLESARRSYEQYLQAEATYQTQRVAYGLAQQEYAALQADQTRLEGELSALEAQLNQGEAQATQLRSRLDELVKREGQLFSEARAAKSEAERLEAFLRAGSDLAEGPRQVKQAGLDGILGVVADLLQVPAGLEVALEVTLAGRMQWVLTRDDQAARAGIEHLKRAGGRATFLPLTLLKSYSGSRRDLRSEAGVRGLARELAQLPGYEQALPTLLGDTLILESLDAALALARRYPDHPRLVTLEGELLETSGALTGGRLHKGGQMLALRRRASEAASEAERLQTEGEGLAAQAAALRQELATLELGSLREHQANLLAELRAVTGSLARRSQVVLPEPPLAVEMPQTEVLGGLRLERDQKTLALNQARESLLAWRRYREDLSRFEDSQQALQTARQQMGQFDQEEQSQQLQLQLSLDRQSELSAARQALDIHTLEAALQQARALVRSLAEQESAALARTNTVLGELETAKLTQARREATIEAVQTELQEVPDGPIEEGTSRGLAAALNRVEAELSALGPVNHLAEREYAALQEELKVLEATLAETQEAVLKLQIELEAIETEYRERLEGIYLHFKDRFSEYARTLLDAEVQLERAPTGLNLVLRPEGKRTVNLNLLSMGERTMGALAFLFALSEVGENGGLPIAVLDEVDAPLDEANIQRLCRFLRHFSSQTQFILVTHQKRTMEACDALYGVTSDKGISRVYSIRREEAVA